jgi:uncharacterized membrane protein YdjX (TVP38/TMEM64 family)
MANNYTRLAAKSAIGILLVIGAWWMVKCQCINVAVLTPAAIRDYIRQFGNFAALIYIIAYALNTVSIFPPIGILSLAAGLIFGEALGAVYLLSGALTGTSITFILSRYFGRGLVEKMLKGRFKGLDEKLAEKGFMTVLFFRVIPLVPYEVLNYVSGLSGIKFRDYFFATFLGLIPGVFIAAFFGAGLGRIRSFGDIFTPKFLGAFGLVICIILIPVIYRLIKKKAGQNARE